MTPAGSNPRYRFKSRCGRTSYDHRKEVLSQIERVTTGYPVLSKHRPRLACRDIGIAADKNGQPALSPEAFAGAGEGASIALSESSVANN
jgi:hypothetical protein